MTDRTLEYIKGQFDGWKEFELSEHATIRQGLNETQIRLDRIEEKVDSLRLSRERLYGMAAVLGVLGGGIAGLLGKILLHG